MWVNIFDKRYFWEFFLDFFLKFGDVSLVLLFLVDCRFYFASLQRFAKLLLYYRSQLILHNQSALRQWTLLSLHVYPEILNLVLSLSGDIDEFHAGLFGKFKLILHLMVSIRPGLATIAQKFVCLLSHHSILLFFEESLTKFESLVYALELGIIVDSPFHF